MSTAYEVVCDAIEPLLAKHGLDHKFAIKLANEAINALEVGGWHTTEDEHLATLRMMRKRIQQAVSAEETPARDLASLSRRLQDLSREVSQLEEKERQEKPKGGSDGTAGNSGATSSTAFDPTQV